MTSGVVPVGSKPRLAWLRWVAGLGLVVALHGAAMVLLRRQSVVEVPPAPVAAVLIDLTPAPPPTTPASAPPQAQSPEPVPPEPPPSEPPPVEPPPPEPPLPEPPHPEPPPPMVAAPKPDVVLPPPQPRAVTRPRPRPPKLRPPQRPPEPAPVQAAPEPLTPLVAAPAQVAPSVAAPPAATWDSLLGAHLARFRRYPPEAERRGLKGVAVMRFSVDRTGRIVGATLVRSSGHDLLDEEAVAWLQRAQPLPAPPPERAAPLQITVPLSFTLR